jgi:cyclic beta-1,2-glucan synthetase
MINQDLKNWMPQASPLLLDILNVERGPLLAPIRSEIFGAQRFAQHGLSLGETHRARVGRSRTANFFPRLQSNIEVLRLAHSFISVQASTGFDISPAAEWLLDNFHLIGAQSKEIHEGLPRSYFRALPVLQDEPLAGLPRVYGIAWAFVAHTDSAFDEDLLVQFLLAYQETRELNLSEMWALPTTLRVVLIENLRRLAERVATNKAAREIANLCCDKIDNYTPPDLDRLLEWLTQRGVGLVFLAQMVHRLQDRRSPSDAAHHRWLAAALPDMAAVQHQPADQAADNLSVSNAVTSLRAIGDADWPEIVARTSTLMRLMLTAPVFQAEQVSSQDLTLHAIERLARRSQRSEVTVANALLTLMGHNVEAPASQTVAEHWLSGPGRTKLNTALGLSPSFGLVWPRIWRWATLPAYLTAIVAGTLGLVAWALSYSTGVFSSDVAGALALLAAALMLFPASETVVAVVNRLISESAQPQHLPRLALATGIPPEHRVVVVIPAMLTHGASARGLALRLEQHYLANPEAQAQFALLTDWADADTPELASDADLLQSAVTEMRQLNARYTLDGTGAPRFIVLHRGRQFSDTEQRWIGWERKRGKLEQLVSALAQGTQGEFIDLGEDSRLAGAVRYVLTLDSDTQLPPGRLRELVGVAAHPCNQPVWDAESRRVVSGYSILQPHVATPLPDAQNATPYRWLFAGQCGIDPYSAATSEVYQDLFGEGTFTGKGLLSVQAVHAVLSGRLPDGQVLSHDLLEGSIGRCAAVTDVAILEDAPSHADVAASRVHRWTRGDWQLLPFLCQPRRYGLRAINAWKIFDNLRRSLVAPASLALLLLSLAGVGVSAWAALGLVVAAFSAGPLMGSVAGFSPSRDDIAKIHFYRGAVTQLLRAIGGGAWHLALLLEQSLLAVDAIVRALYRQCVNRRDLLQWTTAEMAQAQASTELLKLARAHWSLPVVSAVLLASLLALGTAEPVLATFLCLLWAATPLWIWGVSRGQPVQLASVLQPEDQAYLKGIARDTWRFFERCVVAGDMHLPPDNLQITPYDMVAHRTSPTNIGLYLLSTACARQFGWIGTQELLKRMEATLATLNGLQRHQGHFLNWYDTQTGLPMLPMYVSTVDSGNLSGHLLAVAQACRELAAAPYDDQPARHAITTSCARLNTGGAAATQLAGVLPPESSLLHLLALVDPMADCQRRPSAFAQRVSAAQAELAMLLPPETAALAQAVPAITLLWCLSDHLNTLQSAAQDATAHALANAAGATGDDQAAVRLQALARHCEELAWQADFSFLFHRKRHLFHIGFRVAEQTLDAGFYDLLASESRLTSLLAIAKGDVPVRHWASLGRSLFAVGPRAGLLSWSGSMFEYLMPSLVLEEPAGSLLHSACEAALVQQMAFARAQEVPWGISESAYAGSDHTLAYQYAPQGVAQLALRRTPVDELVIAPYATALAAQISPRTACLNFRALEALGARARYGFIEALDYSPARQAGTESFTPVNTFMSHHQGMSLVALANILLDAPARRWGMENVHIESVASLLQERTPREVSALSKPPALLQPRVSQRRRAPRVLRELMPGAAAIEPTHVLSNGRYSVSLRPNGAGWSRWGQIGINRWRDDALRDAFGSFFYVNRPALGAFAGGAATLVSITQHPAPDPGAHYSSTFHADRVCFDALWPKLRAHTTVWVSPEDDIEFRQVELCNLSDQTVEIELTSAFEITLADALADEAHPAFTNLFVRAQWQPDNQALWFERKPRLPTERAILAAHFLAEADPQVIGIRVGAERQAWLGRNHERSQPQALVGRLPDAVAGARTAESGLALETGLDPACVLAVTVRLAPQAKAQLTFATAAADNAGTLHSVIDKYQQTSHVQRASLMSATLSSIRLRSMRITPENFAAIQALTTALMFTLTRPGAKPVSEADAGVAVSDRRSLWRFGISGDRPLILVSAGATQGVGLLRSLTQGLRLWAWGGVDCDLVVINAEPASYLMPLHRELAALRERHQADTGTEPTAANSRNGFHVLRADDLSALELNTLKTVARVHFNADGRPLTHHVQDWTNLHEQALEQRGESSGTAVAVARPAPSTVPAPKGEFVAASGEFQFDVSHRLRPERPWINVLSNAAFGAQISEAGGGYTWALNSRMNQLTAWSNDPVADPPGEWFLLQNTRSQAVWSVTPNAWGDSGATYHVAHGQGYSVIRHVRGDVEVTATWCVDAHTAVKQIQLQVVNRGSRRLKLRLVGLVEWMMGANRSDRSAVRTALYRQRLPTQTLTALLATQREHSNGFGAGTAFFGLAGKVDEGDDWTCDRRECFDARGRLVLPDHFGQGSGDGLDPCAALSTRLDLMPGEGAERLFLLGYASTPEAAQALAAQAALVDAAKRVKQVTDMWTNLLGATTVKTPDPLFDVMVNRWLLYQTVACRLWAKAGFYQAGGATGFRDQLQDAMALAWADPGLLRQQIILGASRQFAQGDVQHWWHAPGGAGVRTHFSDDLLWLPHAVHHYGRVTGDTTLLDDPVPFLEGMAIPPGAEDAYYTPTVSAEQASVYEHAARAIDHSLRVGIHGLPLMGSGDWNDGMNRVGIDGRGESVWLGWFLCSLVADWAPLARQRGDVERAQRWQDAAQGWASALEGPAWDGDWYKRAFFDDGQALGSHENPEARIDLIAQAWAVLSNTAPPERQRQAMAAAQALLVEPQMGLIKLLDPPLANAVPSAGYIQAYPPGVRENGGQYSHAGVWALMAQAQLLINRATADEANTDAPYRYFTYLSPAHRAAHPTHGARYGIEPYVMAGDVYTQPPYVGRGGWSWYTGSAAWMHRAAVESIFGLQLQARTLSFQPCLPTHWPEAELTLVRAGRTLRFILRREDAPTALAATHHMNAQLLHLRQTLDWTELPDGSCFVVPLW